jgi:hypothetical protein
MKSIVFALFLGVVAACGSNESASPDAAADPLVGTWSSALTAGVVVSMKFDGNNYTTGLISLLTNGTYGLQASKGTYSIQGDTVILRKTSSSCQGVTSVTKLSSATFSRKGNGLSFSDSTTIVMFQLSTGDPTGTGVAKLGCYKADNTFQVNPLTPVP